MTEGEKEQEYNRHLHHVRDSDILVYTWGSRVMIEGRKGENIISTFLLSHPCQGKVVRRRDDDGEGLWPLWLSPVSHLMIMFTQQRAREMK